jgi:hypothetical protein
MKISHIISNTRYPMHKKLKMLFTLSTLYRYAGRNDHTSRSHATTEIANGDPCKNSVLWRQDEYLCQIP